MYKSINFLLIFIKTKEIKEVVFLKVIFCLYRPDCSDDAQKKENS